MPIPPTVDATVKNPAPTFWNVVSNLAFLWVAFAGLREVLGGCRGGLPSMRSAYGAYFVGVAAVSLGSGYYHAAPSTETLVWDRLPMAFSFMTYVGIVWAGSPTHSRDRFRSLPLASLTPLLRTPGVRFHSLQKGPAAATLAAVDATVARQSGGGRWSVPDLGRNGAADRCGAGSDLRRPAPSP